MDLINTLSDSLDIFKVDVEVDEGLPELYTDVYNNFGNLLISALHSSKQLQELLPQLVESYGDVDSYEEWEPEDYLNFKDFIVTPKGIRGLTDGFWSWGVAFTYEHETGILHIDSRVEEFDCLSIEVTGGVEEVSDLPEEVKTEINNYFDNLIAKYPLGFVATVYGYTLLDESSYKK